jgi:hypothetical protein
MLPALRPPRIPCSHLFTRVHAHLPPKRLSRKPPPAMSSDRIVVYTRAEQTHA